MQRHDLPSCVLFVIAMLIAANCYGGRSSRLLQQGWEMFARDNDTQAIRLYQQGLIAAGQEHSTADKALGLLYMGICYYGMSYSEGLSYALRSMDEYKKLEASDARAARLGRARCLQLVSTIKSRQGSYRESIELSKEALVAFQNVDDTNGYPGIIYTGLGAAYRRLGMPDSSAYYYELALQDHQRKNNLTYLPGAYIFMADIALTNNQKDKSRELYMRALHLADSTGNRQAQVLALLGLGNWELSTGRGTLEVFAYYEQARIIAQSLSDKSFLLATYRHFKDFYTVKGRYQQAMPYQDSIATLSDSVSSWDKQKETRSLEIQFEVAEKDRSLKLARQESRFARLTNYMLGGGILLVILVASFIIHTLRRINRRDQALLRTKEALLIATTEQKRLAEEQQKLLQEQKLLREQQMQRELEFKESQLSALTLQMLQKNELMQELKERLEEDRHLAADQKLNKIISKGLTKDKEWDDFNTYFETVNTQFYTRLKQAYPDISPNDLRLCALIKLNLSSKEMAAILNISPDSVKTARYRLRKKLQLNTEDNLTNFILSL